MLSVLGTVGVTALLGSVSALFLGEYGIVVFIFIPFLLGFLPNYIALKYIPLDVLDSFSLGLLTLFLASLSLLIFAVEGLICILMASPILVLMVL